MNKILAYLGREPIKIGALIAAALGLVSGLGLPVSIDQQGVINAAIVLVIGLINTWVVSVEKALPLIVGAVQAAMSVALSFGLLLSPQVQASVMTFVVALVAMWTRTQVTAPVPPEPLTTNGFHALREE
jgi:hypothetical protein